MALAHRVGWDPLFVRRSTWFWPLAAAAERLAACEDWPTRAELDAMYRACTAATGRNAPSSDGVTGPALRGGASGASVTAPALRGGAYLSFADNVRKDEKHGDQPLRLDRLYDGRIAVGHEVPTRERDWHDLFNALCFATYPRAKLALHRRQYAILQECVPAGATRLPAARTREQDALTLLDEGGAALAAEPSAADALRAARADARSAVLRDALAAGRARVVPFGHALFEHLVEGLRCPGGFTQVLELPSLALSDAQLLQTVDEQLAAILADRTQLQSPSDGGHLRLDDLGLK